MEACVWQLSTAMLNHWKFFKKQLLYIPDISISAFLVETILLDDNPQALLSSYDLILTTTTHYEQVAEHIGEKKNILVKVAVAPSRDTIVNISRLDLQRQWGFSAEPISSHRSSQTSLRIFCQN